MTRGFALKRNYERRDREPCFLDYSSEYPTSVSSLSSGTSNWGECLCGCFLMRNGIGFEMTRGFALKRNYERILKVLHFVTDKRNLWLCHNYLT